MGSKTKKNSLCITKSKLQKTIELSKVDDDMKRNEKKRKSEKN